ncbi:MAG: hypothetical protein JO358_04790 [Alphaproteobacteria bacterium]|nr:hypothetical protein [Alphaproteobacteria bacterium]
MRRRDFTLGRLLANAVGPVRAQQPPKQRRIAIVISTGPVACVDDPTSHAFQAFWQELHRFGDDEGENLIVGLQASPISLPGSSKMTRR